MLAWDRHLLFQPMVPANPRRQTTARSTDLRLECGSHAAHRRRRRRHASLASERLQAEWQRSHFSLSFQEWQHT